MIRSREFVAPGLLRVNVIPPPTYQLFVVFTSGLDAKIERYDSDGNYIDDIATKTFPGNAPEFFSLPLAVPHSIVTREENGTTSMTLRAWDVDANSLSAAYTLLRLNGSSPGNRGLSRPYVNPSDGMVYWVEGEGTTGVSVVWTLKRATATLGSVTALGTFSTPTVGAASAVSGDAVPFPYATATKVHFPMDENGSNRWISFNWDGTGGESVARDSYTTTSTPINGAILADGRTATMINGTIGTGNTATSLRSIGNDFRTNPADMDTKWTTPTLDRDSSGGVDTGQTVSVVGTLACVGCRTTVGGTAEFFLVGDPEDDGAAVRVDLTGRPVSVGWTYKTLYAVETG